MRIAFFIISTNALRINFQSIAMRKEDEQDELDPAKDPEETDLLKSDDPDDFGAELPEEEEEW
jgi:hypothetical protein